MKNIPVIFTFFILISSCTRKSPDNMKMQVILESDYWFRYDWTNDTDKIIGVPDGDIYIYDIKNKKKQTILDENTPGVVRIGISWFPSNKVLIADGFDDGQSLLLIDSKYLSKFHVSYIKKIIEEGANPSWLKKDTSFVYDTSNFLYWPISEIFLYNIHTKENIKISDGFLPSTNYKNLIVFCSLKEGYKNGLYLYNLDHDTLKQITRDTTDEQSALDRGSKFVVFTRGKHLWLINLDTMEEKKLLDRECLWPKISPFDNSIWVWVKIEEDSYNLVKFTLPESNK